MADKNGGDRGEGSDQTGQGGEGKQPPTGGQGTQPGAVGTAGAGGGQGAQGGAGKPVGLSPDVLPEDLRGKSEAEIRFMLNQMVTGTKGAAKKIQELENKLRQMEEKPKEPEKPKRPYEERILDEPDAVIEEIVRERFGGTINELQKQTGEAAFATVKTDPRFSDFGEYEDEIREILSEAQMPATRENIMGAYTMAVGQKTLQEREAQKRQQQNQGIERGGDPPPAEDKTPEITGLEREVMIASGFTDEKEWLKYKNTGDVAASIRVPDGKRRENNNG